MTNEQFCPKCGARMRWVLVRVPRLPDWVRVWACSNCYRPNDNLNNGEKRK